MNRLEVMHMNKLEVIKTISDAVSSAETTANKWRNAGLAVRDWYTGGFDAFKGEKQALIKELIVPALPKKQQADLLRELPRKGTEQAAQFSAETLAQLQQDKIRARAYADAVFRSVMSYAFQAELEAEKAKAKANKEAEQKDADSESEEGSDSVTLKTRILTDISALIKKCQKSEGEDFDLTATVQALQAVINTVSK